LFRSGVLDQVLDGRLAYEQDKFTEKLVDIEP
jgi:hypothetical protein